MLDVFCFSLCFLEIQSVLDVSLVWRYSLTRTFWLVTREDPHVAGRQLLLCQDVGEDGIGARSAAAVIAGGSVNTCTSTATHVAPVKQALLLLV